MQKQLKRIEFENVQNFRDLGGYEALGEKTVQWNKLYRSDSLAYLSEKDKNKFLSLGIKTIVDLRSPLEVQRDPDVKIAGIDYYNCPLQKDDLDMESVNISAAAAFEKSLFMSYPRMVAEAPDLVAKAFSTVAQGLKKGAVVFHCTAGKDRTGILSSMIYYLLGVCERDIVADYEVSHTYNEFLIKRMAENIKGFEKMLAYINSDPENMIQLIAYYKTAELKKLLLSHGVKEEEINGLQSSLLE